MNAAYDGRAGRLRNEWAIDRRAGNVRGPTWPVPPLDGAGARVSQGCADGDRRTAAELTSTISPDSSTASNCAAGIVFSSLNRLSGQDPSSVPLKYQLLPLSARIRP